MAVSVRPIATTDVPAVAEFLHAHLNDRVTADSWARAMAVPWKVDAPNHGFMLVSAEGAVVGAYLAFYSERTIAGQRERFCNLGAWCVLPDHRFHSLRLLKALLAQDGYHFTDLSPSGNVVPVNTRMKFEFLDTATALVPTLPRLTWLRRGLSADPRVIEEALSGEDLDRYRDHAQTAAACHLVLRRGGESCYVVFRADRRKNLPIFASILHVSNPELFRTMIGPFTRHLLLRHGVLAALAELRVVRHRPRFSFLLGSPRKKMFKSAYLSPDQVDYLYSELVCVAW